MYMYMTDVASSYVYMYMYMCMHQDTAPDTCSFMPKITILNTNRK